MVRIGPVEIKLRHRWKRIGNSRGIFAPKGNLKAVPQWVQKAAKRMQTPLRVYYLKGRTFRYKVKVMPGEFQGAPYHYYFYRKLRAHKH